MGTPLRVLIIEDVEDDALLMLAELKRGGYDPAFVRVDTPEAVTAALYDQEWDIVLSDYAMPRFSGTAALKLFNDTGLDIPFILVSGTVGEDIAIDAMHAGARDYVMKGNLSRLAPAIDRELRETTVRRNQAASEQALRESEEKFRLLAEFTNDWEYWHDNDGQFLYVAPAVEQITGYKPEEFIADKTLIDRIIHPDDQVKNADIVAKALAVNGPLRMEFRIRHRDGHDVWIGHSCVVLFGPDGESRGRRASNRDITVRKRAEEALRESEVNFRAFFESVVDMIFVARPDGRIFFTNAAVTKTLGYSDEELATMHVLDVHPVDKRQEAEAIFDAMFRGEMESCPLPLATRDGTLVPVETRVWFGRWNGDDCIFGMSKNVTAERDARQQFERLFRNNPALMALSSLPERRFTDVNVAFLHVLGYSRDEVIGKTAEELDLFPDAEQQTAVADKLEAEGHISEYELQVRCKNGDVRYGLFSGDVLSSQGLQYFLTVMLDITARKHTEQEKRDFYRNTIKSVTQGKLDLVSLEEVSDYTNSAELTVDVTTYADASTTRHITKEFCSSKGLSADRLELFEWAIGEAVSNAIKHAKKGHVFAGFRGDAVWVAVSDNGPGMSTITLPGATLRRGFSTEISLGMGYTIMMEGSDEIKLCTSTGGTTVVLVLNTTAAPAVLCLDNFQDTWDQVDFVE